MGSSPAIVTAGMLAIGDELLSGRTKDKNIAYLAEELTKAGIQLEEVRIIPDKRQTIVDAVNALRKKYDYVFTSGGIGPTHDDITAESIALAVQRPCIFDAKAEKVLADYYRSRNEPYSQARRLMARMPEGAEHIANPISVAPGFHIDNVYVMAGVPQIFAAMLQNVIPRLNKGLPIQSCSIPCPFGESVFSAALQEIQQHYPQTSIGSYPRYEDADNRIFSVEIVIRSRDKAALQEAKTEVEKMIDDLKNMA